MNRLGILDEPNHFVQSNASIDDWGAGGQIRHIGVYHREISVGYWTTLRLLTHFLVHQPEGNGLVAHESLVVTLCICNALLPISPIFKSEAYAS